jgi:rSAM/selenodomain-associated transferase 1
MTSVQENILLFTKYPIAGKSKTRLIPILGPLGAAQLQRQMAFSIASKLKRFSKNRHSLLEIHYEGGSAELLQHWLGTSLIFKKQNQGDLGQRMALAIAAHLGEHQSIVLVGSDCPDIDTSILENAFSALYDHAVVLGPAFDGGYYLVGIQGTLAEKSLHFLFSDIDWGEENVLGQTLSRIKKLQLSFHLLKKLHDIDTPKDLKHLNHHPYVQ